MLAEVKWAAAAAGGGEPKSPGLRPEPVRPSGIAPGGLSFGQVPKFAYLRCVI